MEDPINPKEITVENIKKISVVMSTYNGNSRGGYLWSVIDSVLAQTYPLYEIILQDDGSNDDTWENLTEYAKKSSLIKLFRNERNLGVGNAWVSAWNKAKGDYIAVCDDDDVWLPDKISILVNTIGTNLLAIGQSRVIYENKHNNSFSSYENRNPNVASIEKLVFENCVGGGQQLLFHREVLKYVNLIKSDNYIAPDYLLAIIGFYFDKVSITDKITQIFRIYPTSTTALYIKKQSEINKLWFRFKGYKIIYCIYALIIGIKSYKITEASEKKLQILVVLNEEKPRGDLMNLVRNMKNQTIFSYICAAFQCYRFRKILCVNKEGFYDHICSLTYIFKWWFDHRLDC